MIEMIKDLAVRNGQNKNFVIYKLIWFVKVNGREDTNEKPQYYVGGLFLGRQNGTLNANSNPPIHDEPQNSHDDPQQCEEDPIFPQSGECVFP